MKPLLTLVALALAGCLNPLKGEYGPVAVVPERDTCRVQVRPAPAVVRESGKTEVIRVTQDNRPQPEKG